MKASDRAQRPESWDEATDLRRFWWLVFPLGVATWVAGIFIFLDGSPVAGFLSDPVRRTERTEHVFPASEGQLVRLENIRGNVVVRSGAPGEVRVLVERTAKGRTAREAGRALEGFRTNWQVSGDVIRIFMAGVSGEPRSAVTTVTMTLPEGARLEAQTLRGNISVAVETAMVVVAGTADGHIDVRVPAGLSLAARIEAEEVRLRLPAATANDAGGRLLVRTGGDAGPLLDLELRAPAGIVTLRPR